MVAKLAKIDKCECCNGNDIGMSVYFFGCPIRCKNCFNQELWDMNTGPDFSVNDEKEILENLSLPYIKRISLLGGEPLISRNLPTILSLSKEIKEKYPNKQVWLYSGYEWKKIIEQEDVKPILQYIDILVAGPYVDEQRDITLKWRGSANQEVIDVRESLNQNKKILYCN